MDRQACARNFALAPEASDEWVFFYVVGSSTHISGPSSWIIEMTTRADKENIVVMWVCHTIRWREWRVVLARVVLIELSGNRIGLIHYFLIMITMGLII
jgi:hypothetical protein